MPERTCIACRTKGNPSRFFRMVASPSNEIVAELDSRLPGRGAYCCIAKECAERVLKGKNLEKALRGKVRLPEGESFIRTLRSLLRGRLGALLGTAWRKKVVAAGRDAALRAARTERKGRLFLAEDLSSGSRNEMSSQSGCPIADLAMTMSEIGSVFGRRPVGVFFVADGLLADALDLRSSQIRSLKAV